MREREIRGINKIQSQSLKNIFLLTWTKTDANRISKIQSQYITISDLPWIPPKRTTKSEWNITLLQNEPKNQT